MEQLYKNKVQREPRAEDWTLGKRKRNLKSIRRLSKAQPYTPASQELMFNIRNLQNKLDLRGMLACCEEWLEDHESEEKPNPVILSLAEDTRKTIKRLSGPRGDGDFNRSDRDSEETKDDGPLAD